MQRLKVNLAMLAVVLGVSAAFAGSPAKFATTYGYNQSTGLWIQIRSGSHCSADPSQNCEAQFNGDPNNGGTMVPGTLVKGDFVY